jgi:hypothetical protein
VSIAELPKSVDYASFPCVNDVATLVNRALCGQDKDDQLWLILPNASLYLLIRNEDKLSTRGARGVFLKQA